MKFSKATLGILKSFCSINPGMVFDPGNVIQVVRKNDAMTLGRATIDTTIDASFQITDLPQFISLLNTFDDPELIVEEKYILIKEGRRRLNYKLGFPGLVKAYPYHDFDTTNPLAEFSILKEELQKITRIAATLNSSNLAFVGKDGEFFIEATNIQGKSVSETVYSHKLDTRQPIEHDFRLVLEGEKFNWFVATDLDVLVTRKLARFVGKPITYWSSYIPLYSELPE